MQLTRLNNTCSMYELGGLSRSDVVHSSFERKLNNLIFSNMGGMKNKSIIYNTNYSWFGQSDARAKLRSLGFKKVGEYTGSGGSRVYVLLKTK